MFDSVYLNSTLAKSNKATKTPKRLENHRSQGLQNSTRKSQHKSRASIFHYLHMSNTATQLDADSTRPHRARALTELDGLVHCLTRLWCIWLGSLHYHNHDAHWLLNHVRDNGQEGPERYDWVFFCCIVLCTLLFSIGLHSHQINCFLVMNSLFVYLLAYHFVSLLNSPNLLVYRWSEMLVYWFRHYLFAFVGVLFMNRTQTQLRIPVTRCSTPNPTIQIIEKYWEQQVSKCIHFFHANFLNHM